MVEDAMCQCVQELQFSKRWIGLSESDGQNSFRIRLQIPLRHNPNRRSRWCSTKTLTACVLLQWGCSRSELSWHHWWTSKCTAQTGHPISLDNCTLAITRQGSWRLPAPLKAPEATSKSTWSAQQANRALAYYNHLLVPINYSLPTPTKRDE